MKYKLMGLLFSFCAFFSCNHRCIEAMDDARGLKRDTALTYLWRYTNSCRTSSVDSGYHNFLPNGDYERSYTLKELKRGGKYVWLSTNGSFTYVTCLDNGSPAGSTLKYSINGDSLIIYFTNGEIGRCIKVSKPIP